MSIWRGAGAPVVYGSGGQLAGAKIWVGIVSTNASGQWSVDYSSAGFTSAPFVQATCIGPSLAAADIRNADCVTRSATGATGKAVVPAISVLGLITVALAGAGQQVMIQAVGN